MRFVGSTYEPHVFSTLQFLSEHKHMLYRQQLDAYSNTMETGKRADDIIDTVASLYFNDKRIDFNLK